MASKEDARFVGDEFINNGKSDRSDLQLIAVDILTSIWTEKIAIKF